MSDPQGGDPEGVSDAQLGNRNGSSIAPVGGEPELSAAKPQASRHPNPEVVEKAKRRSFTAEYKMRIVRKADACARPGDVGALLRREGLYSSHLTAWRAQSRAGTLAALAPKVRGRRPQVRNPLAREVADLQRQNASLEKKLRKAETIIAVQKKLSEILGLTLESPESAGN